MMENISQAELIAKSYRISELLNKLIELETKLENKLIMIEVAARLNAEVMTGKYTDPFLETELVKISDSLDLPDEESAVVEKDTVLHVMTEAYETGGHTRIVNNWINFDSKRKHSIFVETAYPVPPWLTHSAMSSGGSVIQKEWAYGNTLETAKALYVESLRFEKVILYTHPFDIVPVLAFGTRKRKKAIYLYNHYAHGFWTGVSVADVILEASDRTADISRSRRCVKNTRILPLPLDRESFPKNNLSREEIVKAKEALGFRADSFIVMSISADYKYTDFEPYNFFRFCEDVVNIRDDIYFVLVGCRANDARWVRLRDKSGGRILPNGLIAKHHLSTFLAAADFYVDSFLMQSCTCVLEALIFGLPVVSLKTVFSCQPVIAGVEYNSTEEMLHYISEYVNGNVDFSKEHEEVLAKLKTLHYRDAWLKHMENAVYKNVPDRTASFDFSKFNPQITDFDEVIRYTCKENTMEALAVACLRNAGIPGKRIL